MSLLAYLDPGTGSVILQAVVGGVAAAAVTARMWWGRVKDFFRKITGRGPKPEPSSESPAR